MTSRVTEMPLGSVEYLNVGIVADVALDTQPVDVAVIAGNRPEEQDWTAAAWHGPVATSRTARLLLDGSLDPGYHHVFARFTDTSETPILDAGILWIR